MVTCHLCRLADRQHYSSAESLQVHLAQVHNVAPENCMPFYERACVLRNYVAYFELYLHERDTESYDVYTFFRERLQEIARVLRHFGLPLRFFVTLTVELGRLLPDDEIEISVHFFHSAVHTIFVDSNIEQALQRVCAEIAGRLEHYQERGSGFFLVGIKVCGISLGRFLPPTVGCAVSLPKELSAKQCLVNVTERLSEPERDMCFAFSVLAALHPAKSWHRKRASSYREHMGKYVFPETFPITFPQDVETFERKNSVSINVYGFDKDQKFIYPLKVVADELEKHIDLLLIDNHFVAITNLAGLFPEAPSLRVRCKRCLTGFRSEASLSAHLSMCRDKKPGRTVFPRKGDELYFKTTHVMEEFPYYCVYDFEAILEPSERTGNVYENHVPSSFCLLVIRSKDSSIVEEYLYRGPDCVERFISILNFIEKEIPRLIQLSEVPLQMTPENEVTHGNSSRCAICLESFSKKIKTRDHDHVTGQYRRALCSHCNLNHRINKTTIPLVAHNHSYDLSFILEKLNYFNSKNINVLASSCQSFKLLEVGNLRFIDSFAFLNASLETLVQNLHSKGIEHFHCLRESFPNHAELLARKGVFCYNYITSFESYEEQSLPPREAFFNKLNGSDISEEDYRHAQVVFETMGLKNLGEYSDLYLKTDCLLLADVFQNFRRWTLETYQIEALHFVSLPSLSMSCALKHSKVRLQLIDDPDAYLMIEQGIRGGITQCTTRHAIANVPGTDSYDPQQEESQILDLDVNGLYASTMREPLPVRDFEWMSDEEIASMRIEQVPDDAPMGYILEVDLKYPHELHDSHSDFPLAPVKQKIPYEWLSDYQKNLIGKFDMPKEDATKKLLLTLHDKTKYVVHYRNLKLYLQLGLKVTKIHRVLKFSQRPFLREFIDLNHNMRKQATNSFQKSLSKLFMNSIYGKTIENARKHGNIKLCVKEDEILEMLQKPNLTQFRALSSQVVIFQFAPTVLRLKQPLYAGFSILDISKTVMYDFFYNKLRRVMPTAKALYVDTDSFFLHLDGSQVNEWLLKLRERCLDTSTYPEGHELFSNENKMKLGVFKNEHPTTHLLSFCCLKPKLYAFKISNDTNCIRAKGVKKCESRKLTYDLYKHALETKSLHRVTQHLIARKLNENKSIAIEKVALNPFDNKRFICTDGVTTLPFGHLKLNKD